MQSQADVVLYATHACARRHSACVASSDVGAPGASEAIQLDNPDGEPRTFYVFVDSYTATEQSFRLVSKSDDGP